MLVAVSDSVFPNLEPARQVLASIGAELRMADEPTPDAIVRASAAADALLVTYAKITADMIQQMPRCRIISRFGIGVDNVDLAAATSAGIVVTKVPDYCIDEVSDHALALLLALVRKIPSSSARTHAGVGDESRGADSSPSRQRARAGRVRQDSAAGRTQGTIVRHEGHRLRPVRPAGRVHARGCAARRVPGTAPHAPTTFPSHVRCCRTRGASSIATRSRR